MSDLPAKAIVVGGDLADYPPWSGDQQDAQIEALRFAFLELTRALHEAGRLDMNSVNANLGNAEWIYKGKSPDTLQAVHWLMGALDDTRRKLGPLPGRR